MLVSKFSIKKYKWANWKRWLKFTHPGHEEIDPVFKGRLAALAAYLGWILTFSRGFVTIQEQQAIGEALLKKNPSWTRRPNGAIYNTKGQCMVAAPGTSPHEKHLAVDGDHRIEVISNYVLNRFGLCRPMAYEPWHIQPIETMGVSYAAREALIPVEIPGTVSENQIRLGLPADDIYGPQSHEALTNELF